MTIIFLLQIFNHIKATPLSMFIMEKKCVKNFIKKLKIAEFQQKIEDS